MGWLSGYQYRKKVTISGSSGAGQNYQVKLSIGSSSGGDFDLEEHCVDFPNDIRFTDDDGETLLDYWIEDPTQDPITVWVKVKDSLDTDVDIYVYYGRSGASSASDGDSVFEFFHNLDKAILFQAKNADTPTIDVAGYLAENIVYDEATGKYWWIFTDRTTSPWTIRLAYADSINGPWTVEADPVIQIANYDLDSPHIVKFGNKWYIYYTKYPAGSLNSGEIWVQESDNVNGPYSNDTKLLEKGPSGSWEDYRVAEPYAFELNGTYYLFYMGSRSTVEGKGPEKIGYATASSPTGPFTKYENNPVIDGTEFYLHDPGNYDYAADPFIFQYDDVFYIGVTVIHQHIILYKTTDFVTFKYCEDTSPIGSIGPSGAWDDYRFIRGAVMKFGDSYYLTYAGGDGSGYKMAVVPLLINEKAWDGREYLPRWKPIIRGWKVASENGEKIFKKTGSEDSAASITSYYTRSGNIRIDAEIKHLDTYDLTELLIDVSNTDNMYGGVWGYSDTLRIFSIEGGSGNDWVTTPYTVPENEWLKVSFARIGDTLKLFYGDTTLEWTDSSPLASSHVGIRVGSTKTGAVKKFKVRKYASPEPFFSSAGAEETEALTCVDVSSFTSLSTLKKETYPVCLDTFQGSDTSNSLLSLISCSQDTLGLTDSNTLSFLILLNALDTLHVDDGCTLSFVITSSCLETLHLLESSSSSLEGLVRCLDNIGAKTSLSSLLSAICQSSDNIGGIDSELSHMLISSILADKLFLKDALVSNIAFERNVLDILTCQDTSSLLKGIILSATDILNTQDLNEVRLIISSSCISIVKNSDNSGIGINIHLSSEDILAGTDFLSTNLQAILYAISRFKTEDIPSYGVILGVPIKIFKAQEKILIFKAEKSQ